MIIPLRNCPFCGSDSLVEDASDVSAWVACMECGTQGPIVGDGSISDADNAALAWNTRRRAAAPASPSKEGS